MTGWVILVAVLAALAAVPWILESGRNGVESYRNQAPGRFAKLSQGVTHYQWLGPARGPVIVAVHGLTTPSPVWYAIAEGLGMLGYRVLVYDLFGHGFSDAPRGPQTADFFTQQLDELLKHQGLEDDLTLLGYSMGGAICTAYAARHPEKMRRLMLLAAAGIWLREDSLTEKCRTLPFVGDWLHAVVGVRRARVELRKKLGKPYEIKGIIELQLAEFRSRGFVRSVLSSRRHMLMDVQEREHRTIGREGIPVVAIWAEKDQVIPLRSLGTLTQWNRLVRQEVISGAGHDVPYTASGEIVNVLTEVLRETE